MMGEGLLERRVRGSGQSDLRVVTGQKRLSSGGGDCLREVSEVRAIGVGGSAAEKEAETPESAHPNVRFNSGSRMPPAIPSLPKESGMW